MGRDRACALVVRSGEVLMVHMQLGGRHFWTLPGGGREPGESFEDCAVRELLEETGVRGRAVAALGDDPYDHEGVPSVSRTVLVHVDPDQEARYGHDPEEAGFAPEDRQLQGVAWRPWSEVLGNPYLTAASRWLEKVGAGAGEARIRRAVPADGPRLAEIQVAGWRSAYASFLPEDNLFKTLTVEKRTAAFAQILAAEDTVTWVWDDGVVKGWMSVGPARDADRPGDFEVWGIYLEPAFQGRGIGRALLGWAEAEAAAAGRPSMLLWVFQDNTASRRAYEACGWAADGAVDPDHFLGAAAVRYRKTAGALPVEAAPLPLSWPRPDNAVVLENPWVRVGPVTGAGPLGELWRSASLEGNGGVDLFRYHVNVSPMTSHQGFDAYWTRSLAVPGDVAWGVFSRRLGRVVGSVGLINVRPDHGAVEVGSIWYAREAQKTEVNTAAMLAVFAYVFDTLGYRRLEWKCHDQNLDSRRAALRLGFTEEGLFRQHLVSRGENRDTRWFALTHRDWPGVRLRLEARLNRGAENSC